jgi:hypothetical protein
LFWQNLVTIEEYDGISASKSVDPNFLAVWVQIYKLLDEYRALSMIKNLAKQRIWSNL